MVQKKIVFDEETKRTLGGEYGIMIFMKGEDCVDEKEADHGILNIYDKNGENVKRIYADFN